MQKLTKLLIFLIALQLFSQFLIVECKPKIKKGKGKAFGAGILAGGLAGAAIGHVLTRSASNPVNSNQVPVPSKPTTIMEKSEMLPNGCYKQILKEPDQYDAKRFTETEQLICPQNAPTPANQPTFVYQVPVVSIQQSQPIIPSIHMIQVPVYIQPVVAKDINSSAQTTSTPSDVSQIPDSVHKTTDVISAVTVLPPINHHVPPPAAVTSVPPQVIVLSKKTVFYDKEEKKKNASNSLFANISSFLLSSIVLMFLI